MIRNARARAARRNIWTQIGVSACVLLLPPMALGAAVYSMLPSRDDGAVRHIANPVAEAHAAAAGLRPDAAEAGSGGGEPQSLAASTPQPLPTLPKPAPTASTRASYSLASARQEQGGKTAAKEAGKETSREAAREKDTARVLGPVPVHVTVVVPPPTAAPPATANADSAPTGSINPEPARTAAADVPAVQPAQVPATLGLAILGLATQVPAAEPPLADPLPEPSIAATARKHGRFSYLRHLARRDGARSELRAARWHAQSQHAFSLRNWLQQLNTRQHNTHS
jgi:hypothetical protein